MNKDGFNVHCPECGSNRVWKSGFYLNHQRWLCRDCGYRFSEKSNKENRPISNRQVCVSLVEGAKNLYEAANRGLEARQATPKQADIKGKIIELAWYLRKQGRQPATINIYTRYLTTLLKRGADLNDPESVKDVVSQQDQWAVSTKKQACTAYAAYCLKHGVKWIDPPHYEPQRKIPFIPLEKEIDSLIASCGKKTAAILQTLKETGMRIGEALALKWVDVDIERCTVSVNNPEKNSNPRIFKVTNKLVGMLNALPKLSDKVFNVKVGNAGVNFRAQRKRAALKLQNPRLNQIHFHTLRHWKATTEYAKTKDVIHVMRILGHKNIQNTMLYTQLINFETDEYHSAVAKDTGKAQKLLEAGFEYVCTHADLMLFRKRK